MFQKSFFAFFLATLFFVSFEATAQTRNQFNHPVIPWDMATPVNGRPNPALADFAANANTSITNDVVDGRVINNITGSYVVAIGTNGVYKGLTVRFLQKGHGLPMEVAQIERSYNHDEVRAFSSQMGQKDIHPLDAAKPFIDALTE